ncbi:MAG: MFS transporter [Desulfovibrio sp.]|uniref:MFS transporter n=1 Tax=Desulfovibrio sp. 7SRBS1 TaxID=3378064 RepID=UPI003B40D38F
MKRFIPLAGLCLAVFLIMTGMGLAVVALPEKYIQASGTLRNSGWLASVFAVAYLLCQYPVGRLADSRGYRGVVAAGCLLIALSAALFSMAQTPMWIYAGRFIQGAGEAPVWASAPVLLARLYPEMKGRVMGLYNAFFHMGLMFGPGLTAVLPASAWQGWLDPFIVFGVLSLVAMVLVLYVVRETDSGKARPQQSAQWVSGQSGPAQSGLKSNATTPMTEERNWVVRIFCGVPVFGAVYGLLVSCIPVYLSAEAGWHQGRIGAYFFAVYGGIALAQLTGGVLSDRYGRPFFMSGGLALLGGGLIGFVHAPAAFWLGFFVTIGLGAGTFAVSSMALLNEVSAEHRKGTVSGVYYLLWGFGYFAGPLLGNYLGLFCVATGLAIGAFVLSPLSMALPKVLITGR